MFGQVMEMRIMSWAERMDQELSAATTLRARARIIRKMTLCGLDGIRCLCARVVNPAERELGRLILKLLATSVVECMEEDLRYVAKAEHVGAEQREGALLALGALLVLEKRRDGRLEQSDSMRTEESQ
jgi:hypothetical protein